MRSDSAILILLVFLAFIFRPAQQTSTSILSAASYTSEDAQFGSASGVDDVYTEFSAIVAAPKENFEKYFDSMFEVTPNCGVSFTECVKSANKLMEWYLKSIQADYWKIEGGQPLLSELAVKLASKLQSMKDEHLEAIHPEEALNCAVIMMLFVTGNNKLFTVWMGIERLGCRFASSHWNKLADWAIYLARPNVLALPPHLFRLPLFSSDQRAIMARTVFDVLVRGQPFERNGFRRPKNEEASPAAVDTSYFFVFVRNIPWDDASVKELELLIIHFLERLQTITHFSSLMFNDSIKTVFKVLPLLKANTRAQTLAINHLISRPVLERLKGFTNTSTGKDCVEEVIIAAHKADKDSFRDALVKLDPATQDFALGLLVALKRNERLDDIFGKIEELLQQLRFLSAFNLNIIDELFDLVKKLSNSVSLDAPARRRCLLLHLQAESLENLSCPASIASLAGSVRLAFVRYSLAPSSARLRLTANLAFSMGVFARFVHLAELKRLGTPDCLNLVLGEEETCRTLEAVMSRAHLHQLFLDTCTHIATVEKFTFPELLSMIALARLAVFKEDSIKALETHGVFLFKTHLLTCGVLSGEYNAKSKWLALPILNLAHMLVISEWDNDPSRRTEAAKSSFKDYASWLISENHVPRSVEIILKGSL